MVEDPKFDYKYDLALWKSFSARLSVAILVIAAGVFLIVAAGSVENRYQEFAKAAVMSGENGFERDSNFGDGNIYTGVVTRVMDFGAFVEIAPGREGLCHISQLANKRTNKVTDVVNVGDVVKVRVIKVDMEKMKVSLSMKNVNISNNVKIN